MPNLCCYEMNIKGQKENVQTLLNWLNADYHYEDNKSEVFILDGDKKIPQKHHIGYRVFECDYDKEFLSSLERKSDVVINAVGTCAWSCNSCMFEGVFTYISDFSFFGAFKPFRLSKVSKLMRNLTKNAYGITFIQRIKNTLLRKAISLPKACKKLNVEVELYSSETGCCFAEHYYINNKGKVIVDETTDYECICIDDYDTYEEYIERIKKEYPNDTVALNITKEEFENSDGFIDKCKWLVDGAFNYQYVGL